MYINYNVCINCYNVLLLWLSSHTFLGILHMDSGASSCSTVVWTPCMQLRVFAQNSGKPWPYGLIVPWKHWGFEWRDYMICLSAALSVRQAVALSRYATHKSPYVKLHLSPNACAVKCKLLCSTNVHLETSGSLDHPWFSVSRNP